VKLQGVLQRQTEHMAHLIDGLLDMSRIVHGKIRLERQILDLHSLLLDVTSDAQSRLPKDIVLEVDVRDHPLMVDGDAARLTQVFDNLLSNAIKYTPGPATITVVIERKDQCALVSVRDTGDGIDPVLLGNLFTAFQQGRQSLDRKQGGLGLGLAVVKWLVDMHGGQVEARSEGVGRGAEFRVSLPLVHGAEVRPSPAPASSPARKILIVEDNEDFAEMLLHTLESRGHSVMLAGDGDEGIAKAKALLPDVVLCDLGLPRGTSGYDVATALRADPATRGLFLVAVTGYGRDEDRIRSEAAGFNAHLSKPVSLDKLHSVLARARPA
jgi:two-component system, chemotaxis family, CheB/CheR fusion protein